MTTDFVTVLAPRDLVELELGKGLLEAAGIPLVVASTDRAEMLKVLEGPFAEGLQNLAVPADRLTEAANILIEAWGADALKGRINRP